MQTKSLRTIANELGCSHSYLSQVIHGKRPASEKVLTTLLTSGLLEGSELTYNESTSGSNSAVECLLPKQKVASSNLVSRSKFQLQIRSSDAMSFLVQLLFCLTGCLTV
jgi:hypothetical protein